ncbi:MAG: immunoglobulin domain-containing protein [Limisphaerales bacterium]
MKRFLGISAALASSVLLSAAFTLDTANKIAYTDGSQADVAAAIASSSVTAGWTVELPAGNFAWSSGLTVNKAVHVRGAGAGRVIGRSTSSVSVGTGSKTFTTQAGLPISVGQTLRVERTGTAVSGGNPTGTRTFMVGTVTSYSGTSLTLNVTSTGGSGTHPLWIISTMADTTITHNAGGVLIRLTENSAGNVRLSGIRFVTGSGTDDYVQITASSGGRPVFLHDCYFESTRNFDCIQTASNQGIVWNCSFVAFPFSMAQLAIHAKDCPTDSWTRLSTMGAADTTGTSNFYVEDCDFHAWLNATDWDDNSRSVMRRNLFNNAGFGTHGADTSNYGVRHYEVYDNTFVFNGFSDGNTFNLNWFFYLRGGTGVIASNVIPDIRSTDYGDKLEINMTVMNLQRAGGPNGCWSGGYPAPRQVGMGRVTGTAGNDSITYKGDSEPLYIWGNTGTYRAGTTDYGGSDCSNPASSSTFIVAGRDYFNNGTPKPGWSPFPYPHPLRPGTETPTTPPSILSALANATVNAGQSVTFTVSAGGALPLAYQWQKNGANIAGANAPSYSITSVSTNDAGSYRCVVTNAFGSATSAAATLTVNVPQPVAPSVTSQPQSLTRTVGQAATFSVTATGDAPLSYQWQKNGVNIGGATAASFTILSVTSADAGSYRCVVSNAVGTATSAAATLTVESAAAASVRYVDFTAGNDNNPGTMTSPWRRCPGMVGWAGSATLQPGDTVYFDRADTWDIAANSSGPGLDLKAGVKYIGDEWDPQGVGPRRATLRAIGRHETGVVRFWEDHATYVTWIKGFEINANGQRANLVDINHSYWRTGINKGLKRIEDCVAHSNTGNGSEGDYKYGIIISDNSPDASGWVANVEILNTKVYNTPRDGIVLYPGSSGMISNIVVRGCEVYGTGTDPSYTEGHGLVAKGNVKNAVFEYCYSHDVNSSAMFLNGPETGSGPGPSGVVVRYNILQTADDNGVIRFYGTGSKSADIYGNLVLSNRLNGGLSLAGNSGTHNVRVFNNTFYNAFVNLGSPASTGTLEFRNNIIYDANTTPLTDGNSRITARGNNVYFRASGTTLVSSGGTSYTAGTLGTYESSASSANPLFKNLANLPTGWVGVYGTDLRPNNDGLSLQSGSTVLNLGTVLGAPFNGSINSLTRPASGAWTPGAYQFSGGSTPPAPATGLTVTITD